MTMRVKRNGDGGGAPLRTAVVATLLLLLIIFLVTSSPSYAFSPLSKNNKNKNVLATTTAADQAVAVYAKQFPSFRKEGDDNQAKMIINRFIPRKLGMPDQDIFDGTKYKNKVSSSNKPTGKRLTDIDEKQIRIAFTEMSKVYGNEQALQMVQILPICLTFEYRNFAPTLEAFSDTEICDGNIEKAKAMVLRNPGLLAVRPDKAATSSQQTMVFSYIIAITRPVSKLLFVLLAIALSVPVIEGITGNDIHNAFFETILSSGS